MYTFNRSQMKWGMFSGFVVGIALVLLASCAPTPEPLPTYTAPPPLPTYTIQPSLEPLPTYTPFPTAVPPTFTPLPTNEPTALPATAAPTTMFVKVKGTVPKLLLRQVGFNAYGFIYNVKGFPVLSDFIYPHKGAVADRIRYLAGARIEVHIWGDFEFEAVHGFLTNFGKTTIKADGGEEYYVAAERGADGELLFVAAWQVKELK